MNMVEHPWVQKLVLWVASGVSQNCLELQKPGVRDGAFISPVLHHRCQEHETCGAIERIGTWEEEYTVVPCSNLGRLHHLLRWYSTPLAPIPTTFEPDVGQEP